jgi:hypothetical protein
VAPHRFAKDEWDRSDVLDGRWPMGRGRDDAHSWRHATFKGNYMKNTHVLGGVVAASLMLFGAAAQAQGLPPNGDLDRDGVVNRLDNDRDGDGVANKSDPNPNRWNPTRTVRASDMDGDGIADHSDRDRDGDGIANARDPNPNVPNARGKARVDRHGPMGDLDRDGIANRHDRDRDGDGVRNARDGFPNNPRRA